MIKIIIRIYRIILLPFCWFAPASFLRVFFHRLRGVNIGKGVEIGYFVIIDNLMPEKVFIGDGSVVAPRVTILAHDDTYGRSGRVKSGVSIGRDVFIGTNSVILPGVEIGQGAKIGACSLVNKSVGVGEVVGGVPARKLK